MTSHPPLPRLDAAPTNLKPGGARSVGVKKAARLAIVLAFLGVGAALAFAGAMPEGYKGVADVAQDPQAWAGREVELKATIVPGSIDRANGTVTFLAADGAYELPVRWDPAVPQIGRAHV